MGFAKILEIRKCLGSDTGPVEYFLTLIEQSALHSHLR